MALKMEGEGGGCSDIIMVKFDLPSHFRKEREKKGRYDEEEGDPFLVTSKNCDNHLPEAISVSLISILIWLSSTRCELQKNIPCSSSHTCVGSFYL